ncbi:MAG TPA: XRE family transcriptional regulator [Clostridium sp.]|nr:XRE family transcriptional regulator [Clostridium sp.]
MIGERIKELRKENEITQEELAKNIDVSTSMVGMYETNARKPSYEVLIKIAKYFGVSTDYLLNTEEKLDVAINSLNNINHMSKNALAPKHKGISKNDIDKELCDIDQFSTAEEAMQFILKQPSVMGFGGFDINTMSEDEILDFANELLNQLKILSYKYKK